MASTMVFPIPTPPSLPPEPVFMIDAIRQLLSIFCLMHRQTRLSAHMRWQ